MAYNIWRQKVLENVLKLPVLKWHFKNVAEEKIDKYLGKWIENKYGGKGALSFVKQFVTFYRFFSNLSAQLKQ